MACRKAPTRSRAPGRRRVAQAVCYGPLIELLVTPDVHEPVSEPLHVAATFLEMRTTSGQLTAFRFASVLLLILRLHWRSPPFCMKVVAAACAATTPSSS